MMLALLPLHLALPSHYSNFSIVFSVDFVITEEKFPHISYVLNFNLIYLNTTKSSAEEGGTWLRVINNVQKNV